MKTKMLRTFIALMLTMFVVNANAYNDIEVAGVMITSKNASNVLGNGTVSYDESTNTLTLNNARISASTSAIYDYNQYKNETLTIKLIGTNYVKADEQAFTSNGRSLVIKGDGSLDVSGIFINGGDLTIEGNATVNVVKSDANAVKLNGGKLSVFDKAYLKAERNVKYYTFWEIGDIIWGSNVNIRTEGISYSDDKKNFVDKNGNITDGEVVICHNSKVLYPIAIEGTQINAANANDVLDDYGSVKYDDNTKTLTLNNANLSGTCDVIQDYDFYETITINLIGENNINAKYDALSSNGASFIITGNGTLNINGIYLDEGNLTIKGKAKVNVLKSDSYAINLRGADLAVLDDAELTVEGNVKDESIFGIGKFTMGEMHIIIPYNINYSNLKHTFVDENGNAMKGDINIAHPSLYDIWISDVQVTSANAEDVLGDGTVKVVFDEYGRNKIYLNNARLKSSNSSHLGEIYSKKSIEIYCSGNNSIDGESTVSSGIYCEDIVYIDANETGAS